MHSINVYLINKEELREEKLNSLFETEKELVKLVYLGEGIYVTTSIPDSWKKDKLICEIETDYFGGFGEQSAKLFRGKEIIFEGDSQFGGIGYPINHALRMMGVKAKEGMDEFDTIGLGNYRTNEDFDK